MDKADILDLLEQPTKERWSRLCRIRDEAAISDIIAALQASTNPLTRRLLCYIINLQFRASFFEKGSSDAMQALPALIEALDDPDEGVRYAAIEALEDIGNPAAGPALLAQYSKEEAGSSLHILLASAMGACRYTPSIPLLIQALSSSDHRLRYSATRGIGHLQAQDAREPLQNALIHETDLRTLRMIHETLQELGHPSTREEKIDRLIAQLKNMEPQKRISAATALGDIVDQRVIAPLLALLHDEQNEVRQSAILAFVSLGESRDTDWFVRTHKGQIQRPLIQALQDQDTNVQATAAQALARWGDERAVEPLLRVIQDEDDEVRRRVIETVSFLKDERALEPLLHAFLTDDDAQVRALAAEGLGQWEDPRAVNTLLQALRDEQASARRNAAELLCWMRDERATDALLLALRDTDQEVREWSVEALWQLCLGRGDDLSLEVSEKMQNPLLQVLKDEDSEVREGADKILKWLAIQ